MQPIDERDRVAVFVDGEFLFKSLGATKPGVLFDYSKIVEKLVRPGRLTRVWFYTAPPPGYWDRERIEQADNRVNRIRKLPYFHVVMGTTQQRRRCVKVGIGGKVKLVTGTCWEQKGVDVKLAIDMVNRARQNIYDTAVLVSGDGDFVELVRLLQDMGKHVINANSPPNTARSYHPSGPLRKTCDHRIVMDEKFLKDCTLDRSETRG